MSRDDVVRAMRDAQRRSMLDYGAFERGFYGPGYQAPTRSRRGAGDLIAGPPGVTGVGSDYARAGGSYPTYYEDAATIAANAAALGVESPRVPTARIPQHRPDYTVVSSKSDVAELQSQLNSRGAHLKVDGIVGPLTMAAAREFGDVPAATRLQWSGLQQPYPTQQMAQQVPTARIPQARPVTPSDRIAGVFGAAAQPEVRPPSAGLLSALQSPYTTSTGGTNALTARIPQPRPAYPLPVQQAALPPAPLMFHPVQMLRNAAAAAQREAQSRSSQGSRSGMGGGGGYTGGSYGGYGGGSITSGVGGAFRNR